MRHRAGLILLLAMSCSGALAQEQATVVLTNSDPVVAVHSNFRGQSVTLFGSIEVPGQDMQGPFSVAVIVRGPSNDWVIREKQRRLGLVLSGGTARYESVPGYYGIFSSNPLAQIADENLLAQQRLNLDAMAASLRAESSANTYDHDFIRLMEDAGRFSVADRGVVMLTPTAFSVRVPIAANAINGPYLARALVLSQGRVVAEATTRFTVRTQDFERYVAEIARSSPLLYGLATIVLALGTGWLGGLLFRR